MMTSALVALNCGADELLGLVDGYVLVVNGASDLNYNARVDLLNNVLLRAHV